MLRALGPARVAVVIAALAAGAVGLWYAVLRPDRTPPEGTPGAGVAADFESPFRNTRPDVAYVGDAACAECHDEGKTYHAHPMGRSAARAEQADVIERFDAAAKTSFSTKGFDFKVERVGKRIVHRMSAGGAAEYAAPCDVVVGSGSRGRTYITLQGGAAWQSPVSWFGHEGRWDVSPRPDLEDGGRRPVGSGCLFCHTDRVEPVRGSLNRYREPFFPGQAAIGCERCHGPGGLHVAERRAGEAPTSIDYSIVNPKHLSADLRADVCRQCHLQGVERVVRRGRDLFDYRPGLPWDQFVTTFVRRPDLADFRKAVGQFEQMEVSRCFTAGRGGLTCVSCHDPHAKPAPAEADGFYRARCLECHERAEKPCSAPPPERRARSDSCVACHMPRGGSSDVAHTSLTDHRILRRPGPESAATGAADRRPPMIPYPPGPHAPPATERDRDWGIALARTAVVADWARPLGGLAEQKLKAAVERRRDDAQAWAVLADLCAVGGDRGGALAAARAALDHDPSREDARARLAQQAKLAGDFETALAAADRLVADNPASVAHRLGRADIHLRRGDVEKAEADARAALAIQPLYGNARLYLAVCRHQRGDPKGAAGDAAAALRLIPSERLREAYEAWFRQQTSARPPGRRRAGRTLFNGRARC